MKKYTTVARELKSIGRLIFIPALIALVLSTDIAFSQDVYRCGTTEKFNEMLQKDPTLLKRQEQHEKELKEYIEAHKYQKTSGQVYIIPIVFHIIHQNGTENISDAQIFDQVAILNRDFRKLNADTSLIVPEFKSRAVDCEIEFRLAQIDPNGNCTNGIDRIYSYRTKDLVEDSKLNPWPRSKYLNVWVCKGSLGSAGGTAGYSMFPSSVTGANSIADGVIIIDDFIGSIGTGTPGKSRALTHEIGHFLDLPHPWGLTNSPGVECGDDFVDDTPKTKGSFPVGTCNLALPACDTVDGVTISNVQNYMDYSYCSVMYTLKQKERMHAALNSSEAQRNNLWSAANLVATGVDNPQVCVPKADFIANRYFVCEGATITFSDESTNATVTGRSWTFDDGNPATSSVAGPTVAYSTEGWKTVSLTASSAAGSDTKTKSNFVYVSPSWPFYFGTYSEDFEDEMRYYDQWFVVNEFNNSSWWRLSKAASYSGGTSLCLNAYSPTTILYNTFPATFVPGIGSGDVDYAITPSFDLSKTTNGFLNFRLSYASYATLPDEMTEQLKVYYSTNCGQTWIAFNSYNKQGPSLANAGFCSTSFIPTSASMWSNESIALSAIAGSASSKTKVRFKFEFTSAMSSNNLYIDDVSITGTVGINDKSAENANLSLYPNPSNNDVFVSYTVREKQQIKVEVLDIIGKQVAEVVNENQAEGDYTVKVQGQQLNAGAYWVKLTLGNSESVVRKLVVTN